jgi:catechol 2,3-dioxygenase-like lactoylglutathione lyase family enzyme
MIEHVSLRCSDSKASRRFYERVLKPLGYVCDMEYGDSFGFKDDAGRHDFWVSPGKVGTPTHLAFHARSRKSIDEFYAAAVKAGGKDNGEPGPREGYAAYAAFVIDRDGNNVEAVIWEGEPEASNRKRPSTSRRKKTGSSSPRRVSFVRAPSRGRGARPTRSRLSASHGRGT